ncbi:anthranilate synthase component I [Halalkalibacter akibai]|uniref:Anthranilate synthase component 1 n=1 Tax=Halalkalibacter akibai (strain ATCC 43226 / DSM 21942 / CIP 109018 / JCM 9157 / 1139) TaxID=1236973 RepID=W4QSF7_HALA3|nr:anthranilate synthase component I [Halalkalibacter akibai]GAE34558.1 anthranilate synthase [Halalkalibacter akibai JCM 9157]
MITPTFLEFEKTAKTYQTIPVSQRFFADGLTPVQIVHQLIDQVAFLLESKDEQSPWSRYSFIGLNPMFELVEENQSYRTYNKNRDVLIESATFQQAFEETMNFLNVQPVDIPIPFRGGAVGYMSYDAIETIETSLTTTEDNRLPHYQFLFCQTLIAYDHLNKELSILVHVRPNDEDSLVNAYHNARSEIKRISSLLEQPVNGLMLKNIPKTNEEVSFEGVLSNYEKETFLADVEKIKEYIKAGDVFQTVLSQRFEMNISAAAFDVYRVLRMVNPSPYLFYLKFNQLEIVGSSPERLVQVQDGHVEIHPIAGTRKRGKNEQEDKKLEEELLADEKERAEHYMLVDLARNDVGRIAEYGSVQTPTLLEIGKFSHVMHIISKVTGQLREGTKPLEALMASFPAGTVSGAPKIRAMEILQELEPCKRGIYAGAIGYLGYDGNIDSCIAIRTMVIQDGKAYIQAGAGIVADSIPEKEFEETQNKAKALIRAAQLAEKMFGHKEEVYHA